MAGKTQLEKYRDREATRRNALHGGDDPPDYSPEATKARVLHGGDGREPTWLTDDAERERRVREGDHEAV